MSAQAAAEPLALSLPVSAEPVPELWVEEWLVERALRRGVQLAWQE